MNIITQLVLDQIDHLLKHMSPAQLDDLVTGIADKYIEEPVAKLDVLFGDTPDLPATVSHYEFTTTLARDYFREGITAADGCLSACFNEEAHERAELFNGISSRLARS
jgi:hypothetical protein